MNEYRESLESMTDEELEDVAVAAGFEEGHDREWYIDALVRYRESHDNPAAHEPEDLSDEGSPR